MKRRQKRTLLIVLLVLAGAAIAAVVFLGMRKAFTYEEPVIENAGQAVHAAPTPVRTPQPGSQGLDKTINILMIGIDNNSSSTPDARGNADGIMLATINPHTQQIVFTSFLRDTRVRVQDSYYDKLTNVYHTGDVALLRETLEKNFEVPIDYYAIFDYENVVEIVDAVGGVEMELSMEEIYYMDAKIKDICVLVGADYAENALNVDQAGKIKLNGIQAAAYVRIRPNEGGYDVGRTERGRNVIAAVLGKAFRLGSSDLLNFANVFYKKLETDIPDSVFLELGMNASAIRKYKQIEDRIPIDGSYESGNTGSGYYVIPDFEVNNKHLQESLFEGKH